MTDTTPTPTPTPSPGSQGGAKDTYTDSEGYVCTVTNDGNVSFTGGPGNMNETIDTSWTGSAQDAYNEYAPGVIPLPKAVQEFCDKADAAAQALGSAAAAALAGAATTEIAAAFAKEAGEALGVVGGLLAIFGAGAALIAAGAAITAAAIETEDMAQQVMQAGWQGLETSLDLAALALTVQQARTISEEAKQQLQQWAEGQVNAVAAALKGALHL